MMLSQHAAMVLVAARRAPGLGSRTLRHELPQRLTRRDFARAWRELVSAGLVPASATEIWA